MKLPNRDKAFVPEAKIADYLLSQTHETGRHKAVFFARFGFNLENPELFRGALLQHGIEREVENSISSQFGSKYKLKCKIQTPDSRNPCIVTVWIIEVGENTPKLVTAYPAG